MPALVHLPPSVVCAGRSKHMDDWALTEDDKPAPRWLVYLLALAASIALISLVLMGLWAAAMYLVPRTWLP